MSHKMMSHCWLLVMIFKIVHGICAWQGAVKTSDSYMAKKKLMENVMRTISAEGFNSPFTLLTGLLKIQALRAQIGC